MRMSDWSSDVCSSDLFVKMDCATWPAEERARWLALFDPNRVDRLSLWACRKESPWVRETQYNCASVYSRYLECVRRHGLPDVVTPEGLHAFIREAENRSSTAWTVAGSKIGRAHV